MIDFNKYLKNQKKDIDSALKKYLGKYKSNSIVGQAMNYAVFAGGKRFRPILMLAINQMLGAQPSTVMPVACAIEMVHTFSLIHDDLPAMDDDDFRRGKLTTHRKFGEANAILAGDALLALAFQIISENMFSWTGNKTTLKVIQLLSRAIGIEGVVLGQELDLKHENKKAGYAVLQRIHQLKTGALLGTSAEIAAILSTQEEFKISSIKKYAQHLGLAFQIADDILDEVGDFKKIGKTPGSDRRKKKSTYVKLFGIEKAKRLAQQEKDKAIAQLKVFGKDAAYLIKLADFVVSRSA